MSPDRPNLPIQLKPEALAFIEKNGLHYEMTLGLPRIGGRIVGLLMTLSSPAALDDIACTLQISHGSVSTNLRLLRMVGLVEKITLPGDRRDYYQFAPHAWEEILYHQRAGIEDLRVMAEKAILEMEPDGSVRERFEAMAAWAALAIQKFDEMLDTWKGGHRT